MFSKELAKKTPKKPPTKQKKTKQYKYEENNNNLQYKTMRGQLHTTSLNF